MFNGQPFGSGSFFDLYNWLCTFHGAVLNNTCFKEMTEAAENPGAG